MHSLGVRLDPFNPLVLFGSLLCILLHFNAKKKTYCFTYNQTTTLESAYHYFRIFRRISSSVVLSGLILSVTLNSGLSSSKTHRWGHAQTTYFELRMHARTMEQFTTR